ncbi:hypothetical protein MMC11_004315 [Xylographa trunciseda]|nr:hypothetical protein [Xylographa trunciseda]
MLNLLVTDNHAKSAVSSLSNGRDRSSSDASEVEENTPSTPQTNGDAAVQSRQGTHRPHIHHRQSAEKSNASVQSSPPSPREPKQQPAPTLGRKSSWITNISSKFSSSTSSQTASPSTQSQATKPLPSPQREQLNPFNTSPTAAKDVKKADTAVQQPPSSPKSGGTSFLSSALRRLSASSGSVVLGKGAGSGPACHRRVMNVDPHRERCKIQELHPSKLRRVAFCVDVEIAGVARYLDEDTEDNVDMPPPSPGRAPSLTPIDKNADDKKQKDKKIKERLEGESLKHPHAVMDTLEKFSDPVDTDEEVKLAQVEKDLPSSAPANEEAKDPSRKKEKKKRSEEERKQRKERKRQEAVANGTVPVELSRSSSSTGSSCPSRSHSKAQDKPTTDPLRIYRRCCQLRETPILKRITEQVAPPSACDPTSPGTIACLDLSGYWMQLQDIVTLGDYLAVVPVRKLILENCGLTDEALRVVLAGLLAAKTPDQARHNKHLAKKSNGHVKEAAEQLGVIEKLSLKNNPAIGKDGWKYIGLFIYMSRSIKAIDLSLIPLPQQLKSSGGNSELKPLGSARDGEDVCITLQRALAERLAGPRLEELVMAECNLGSRDVERIVEGVIRSGATRLGLAGNKLDDEALQSIARYVKTGKCEGLDLGGNDLSSNLKILADALDDQNALYALSLADCNLTMSSLKVLFPTLIRLPNFRFIDLSHNRKLFAAQPNALACLRKFLPQMAALKRIHLTDVAMSSEQAIAIAEVLPESPVLAHLNILENPELTALASAKDEASQEEACALYASLMAAVRVSNSIICIDIDVPSPDSSEIVKALAKQVVAYCLRNMERGPAAEAIENAAASIAGPHGGEKYVAVPDILLHLVGHIDGSPENHDNDDPAPDDDYIVGGTGVVKALGVVLGNQAADNRRPSRDVTPTESGTVTPKQAIQGAEMAKGKAKNMSRNLLESARKIRMRLQPALLREQRNDSDGAYSKFFFGGSSRVSADEFLERLLFLDSTLERMIQRFEDEFPECRLRASKPSPVADDALSESGSLPSSFTNPFNSEGTDETSLTTVDPTEDEEGAVRVPMSRQHSDVSLASRFLTREEGQMHRFGQQIRRDILRPELLDYAHGTTGQEVEATHLLKLRHQLEAMEGAEIKDRVEKFGPEAVLRELGATADELLLLEKQDPEGYEKFREAQMAAQQNQRDNPRSASEAVV